MRKLVILSWVLMFSLGTCAPTAMAAAGAKEGTSCPKLSEHASSSGFTFECVSRQGRNMWHVTSKVIAVLDKSCPWILDGYSIQGTGKQGSAFLVCTSVNGTQMWQLNSQLATAKSNSGASNSLPLGSVKPRTSSSDHQAVQPVTAPLQSPVTQASSAPTSQPAAQQPSPPVVPTSFTDLYANRAGIMYGAWSKSNAVFQASTAAVPPIQIFTGPNTKPFESDPAASIGLVAKILGGSQGIKKVNVFYFSSQDLNWAVNLVQSMMGAAEYQKGSIDVGGPLVQCQTNATDCNNSLAWTTADGTAYLILGVTSNPDEYEKNYGVSDSEFYHAIWEQIYLANNALQPSSQPSIYPANEPPFWLHLGGELLSACLAGSNLNFESFAKCTSGRESSFKWAFPNASLDSVNQYLDITNLGAMWSDSHRVVLDEALPMGTDLLEIFIALKGPSVMTDFDNMMSQGKSFTDAFQTEFGTTWQNAEPEIAKVVLDKAINNY